MEEEGLEVADIKEICDPLYGFIPLDPLALKIIDTKIFQRLRFIRQLGLAFLVFPGANHTRFEHSLGVYYLTKTITKDKILWISALLHDLGHPPFSHTSEVLLGKKSHEDYTQRIILETPIYELLREEFSPQEVELIAKISSGKVKSLISQELGTDRMDYLRRDAYFCGVPYGNFDLWRILNNFLEFKGKFVVRINSLRAVEDFILSRYFMFEQVYFHRVVRILSIHLLEFLKKFLEGLNLEDLNTYLSLNDATVISAMEKDRETWGKIFERKHMREVFKTEREEEFLQKREEFIRRFGEENLRFDVVKKKVYEGDIYLLDRDKLLNLEEVSPLIRSIKEIKIYRIFSKRISP